MNWSGEMKTKSTNPNESKNLIVYFFLAYAISWSIGIPLALADRGIIPAILPSWSHYLVGYGPMLSALIVTGFSQGTSGLKHLGKRMIRWVCPKWVILAFAPFILGFFAIKILNVLTGSGIRLSNLGALNYLPSLSAGVALLLWILTFGLGEETGWRGFALPRLQRGRSALGATMILAALWALWHLPQFFYLFDPFMVMGWLVGLFAGAVVLTWLYNSANESILIVAVWHGCFNFITASIAETGMLPAVMSTIVILWAVLVIVRTKPKHLMSL